MKTIKFQTTVSKSAPNTCTKKNQAQVSQNESQESIFIFKIVDLGPMIDPSCLEIIQHIWMENPCAFRESLTKN